MAKNTGFLKFDQEKCILCGKCIDACPFGALSMNEQGIEVNENCRMCSMCVRTCEAGAITLEQKRGKIDKSEWKDFLIYAETEETGIHPVVFELIGEARKMAVKVDYKVNAVLIGAEGTKEKADELLRYGVDTVYVYEHPGFEGFKADCYTDAMADCISSVKPGSVLIGGTALGRSLAPRLATRFHTGLTADCTSLDIRANTDMVQIRPAFGGNVMAQIMISHSRPQFATVRYRVMDKALPVKEPKGQIVLCEVNDGMVRSRIEVLSRQLIERTKSIEEEDVLVAVGRGAAGAEILAMAGELADELGGQLAFTRPMVEKGYGDSAHQIGLSGRTVRPKLIITLGVSGAIQFTTCMQNADCIVAVNRDPKARIFDAASYCIVDDVNVVLPELLRQIRESRKEAV